LTSDNAPIYHPQRWDEEKLASKRSASQPSRKGASYKSLDSLVFVHLYQSTEKLDPCLLSSKHPTYDNEINHYRKSYKDEHHE
jgi:hypothetical protein